MRGLDGRSVLMVAGAGTIGTRVSRRLGEEGARVAVADLDLESAQRIADEITDAGGTAIAIPIDVTIESTITDAIDTTVDAFGTIEAAHVNVADLSSAVLANDVDVVSLDMDVFDRVITVNLRGHVLAAKHLVPALVERGGGPIVFTSSAGAYLGGPTMVSYAIAKSGLNALVRHIASAYGKKGIRANAVAPGLVLDEANGRERDPAALEGLLARMASDRLGRAEDIASMVALLLSDDGVWINGQIISVDGGMTLRP